MPKYEVTGDDGKPVVIEAANPAEAVSKAHSRLIAAPTAALSTGWGGGKPDLGAIADAGGEGVPNPNTLAALAMGAVGNPALGALQLLGVQPPALLTSLQKAAEKDPSGGVGEVAGSVYNPINLIPGVGEEGLLGRILNYGARGGLQGLLTPAETTADRLWNTTLGAVTGGGLGAAGRAIEGGLTRFGRRIVQMNREAQEEVLSSLGIKPSGKVGQPGLRETRDMIGKQLDAAQSQLSLNIVGNSKFTADLGQVWTTAHDNPETGKIFDRLFNKNLGQLFASKSALSGTEVAKAVSNLRNDIDAIAERERPSDAEWSAVNNLRDAIHVIYDNSQGPAEAKKLLTDANTAYAKYITLRRASSSPSAGSIASPATLLSAMQQRQGSRFALDTSRLRKIAEDAALEAGGWGHRVLRSVGTALGTKAGIPHAVTGALLHEPPETPLLRISRQAQAPPGVRAALGQTVRQATVPAVTAAERASQTDQGPSP